MAVVPATRLSNPTTFLVYCPRLVNEKRVAEAEPTLERWAQRLSPLRQAVLHLRRNLVMDDPADDSVGFHLAKLLDEHLLGNGGNRSTQVREAQHVATEEMKQDHRFHRPSRILRASSTPRAAEVGISSLRLPSGEYPTCLCVLVIWPA
jgi:hypothetical protein